MENPILKINDQNYQILNSQNHLLLSAIQLSHGFSNSLIFLTPWVPIKYKTWTSYAYIPCHPKRWSHWHILLGNSLRIWISADEGFPGLEIHLYIFKNQSLYFFSSTSLKSWYFPRIFYEEASKSKKCQSLHFSLLMSQDGAGA